MLQGMRIFFAQQASFKDILYHFMKDSKTLSQASHHSLMAHTGAGCPGKERILPPQLTTAFQNLLWTT